MPSCIINTCTGMTRTNKEDEEHVIMHPFPKDLEKIRAWLSQTKQEFSNVKLLAENILQGNKTNKYRLCSKHFHEDCYENCQGKKRLREEALPTIFPKLEEGLLIDETLQRKTYTRRKRAFDPKFKAIEKNPSIVDSGQAQLHYKLLEKCSVATQTDANLTNSDVILKKHFTTVVMEDVNVLMQRETGHYDCGMKEGTENLCSTPQVIKKVIELSSPQKKRPKVGTTPGISSAFEEGEFWKGIEPLSPISEEPMTRINADESVQEQESYLFEDKRDMDYLPNISSVDDSDLVGMYSDTNKEKIQQVPTTVSLTEIEQVQDRKLIIFESCLNNLILKVKCQFSSDCPYTVKSFTKRFEGSYCLIRGECYNGHKFDVFETQPKIGNFSSGNLLLSASILFSGLNFQKIKEFLDLYGVVGISEKTYYRHQSSFLFPAIHLAWKKDQEQTFAELQSELVCIAGDGQCDSPGHSAKYCVYSIMDLISDRIVDFQVVQKSECTSSVAMEKFGFSTCMERLKEKGLNIKIFASDRHVGIRKKLREDYPSINHQFDVWHYAKSIKKKLTKASRLKFCKSITPWIEKIALHFWWSIKHCETNVKLLEEKWLSLLHHIANVHEWEGIHYKKCSHGPLEDLSQERKYLWLNTETPPFKNIEKIVKSPELLKEIPNLVYNCHTGSLESFHSLALKYRTKRIHFGIDAMEARTILAALTHNFNIGRKQATIKVQRSNSESFGVLRTKTFVPKGKQRWSVRNVYEKLSVEFMEDLSIQVLKIANGTIVHNWQSRAPSLPPNLSNLERPNKEEIKKMKIRRFNFNSRDTF